MIRNRLEGIVFPIRLVDDIPFKPVVSIAYGAIKKPKEEQVEAAQDLLLHLNKGLLENPLFYQKVHGSDHLYILRILATIVPDGQNMINRFVGTEEHKTIIKYVQGIINNKVRVEFKGFGYTYDKHDYRETLAFRLKYADFPPSYLDRVCEEVGLPLLKKDAASIEDFSQFLGGKK